MSILFHLVDTTILEYRQKVKLIKLGMVKNLLSTNTQSNIYGIPGLGIARITESGRQTLGIDTLNFKIY
jgi:hypothetical protein